MGISSENLQTKNDDDDDGNITIDLFPVNATIFNQCKFTRWLSQIPLQILTTRNA